MAVLSVAAVPVMFLLRAVECLRKREKLWLDALLLVGSAMIAWYLWFPAMVWMAGVWHERSRVMFWKIYRIQLYVTMALSIGFFLLFLLGNGLLPQLEQLGLMKLLTRIVACRMVLPIGMVLAILARREGVDSGTLFTMQAVMIQCMLPGLFAVVSYAFASAGI